MEESNVGLQNVTAAMVAEMDDVALSDLSRVVSDTVRANHSIARALGTNDVERGSEDRKADFERSLTHHEVSLWRIWKHEQTVPWEPLTDEDKAKIPSAPSAQKRLKGFAASMNLLEGVSHYTPEHAVFLAKQAPELVPLINAGAKWLKASTREDGKLGQLTSDEFHELSVCRRLRSQIAARLQAIATERNRIDRSTTNAMDDLSSRVARLEKKRAVRAKAPQAPGLEKVVDGWVGPDPEDVRIALMKDSQRRVAQGANESVAERLAPSRRGRNADGEDGGNGRSNEERLAAKRKAPAALEEEDANAPGSSQRKRTTRSGKQ